MPLVDAYLRFAWSTIYTVTYLTLKFVHIATGALSISGFVLRGYWMLRESGLLTHRVTRVLPHIVDTVFLASGLALVWIMGGGAWQQPWLHAKLAGLVGYVLLGTVALKRGPTRRIRGLALAGAIAVFAYIVGVAVSKSPMSWLVLTTI